MTMAGIRWSSTGRSDRGGKRKINEDSVLQRPDAGIWLAADGMGGHEAGDIASRMIATAVAAVPGGGSLADTVERVEQALVDVNVSLRDMAVNRYGGRTMGSTVVALVAGDTVGVCLWAGDSRLYRLRAGRLERLSSDHSEVQELLDRGLISAEEAVNHPHGNVITRAVGGAGTLYVDVRLFDVAAGDTFLLCTDGLYNELEEHEIRAAVDADLEASADRLLAQTLARGARDNVSFILVRAMPV